MKRAPLKRKTPLRARHRPGRPRTPSAYKVRERATDYMLAVKRLLCCAWIGDGQLADHRCEGPIEADHAGRRSVGRKAADDTCIPLCALAHRQRHGFSGPFRGWTGQQMREWLDARIADTRRQLAPILSADKESGTS